MSVVFVAPEPRLIQRGAEYGEQYVAGIAAGRRSLAEGPLTKADWDPRLQGLAKMAECAFCIFAGKNPDEDLDWYNERKNGEGHDLVVQRFLFDIKHTENGRLLLWPVTKNHLFWEKDFNTLALVIGTPPAFEIAGLVSKDRFWREKQEAGEGNRYGLIPGTWFMHRDFLADPLSLKRVDVEAVRLREPNVDRVPVDEPVNHRSEPL